jgi:hypothetical protein
VINIDTTAQGGRQKGNTFIGWQVVEIYQDGEVVASLGRYDVGTVLAREDLLGAILDEVSEAADLEGDEDLALGLGGGDVEGDTIKVGYGLVDMGGRSSGCDHISTIGGYRPRRGPLYYPENLSVRTDCISTFW